TPALRSRIKIAAFQRGETVADMLRTLLAREFPETDGGKSRDLNPTLRAHQDRTPRHCSPVSS
ncbi:hypothetical protein ACJEND_24380, partial [Escherichia coli]